jgi:succinate dehydrogenase / fumarate reductase flavoprotein subunit
MADQDYYWKEDILARLQLCSRCSFKASKVACDGLGVNKTGEPFHLGFCRGNQRYGKHQAHVKGNR